MNSVAARHSSHPRAGRAWQARVSGKAEVHLGRLIGSRAGPRAKCRVRRGHTVPSALALAAVLYRGIEVVELRSSPPWLVFASANEECAVKSSVHAFSTQEIGDWNSIRRVTRVLGPRFGNVQVTGIFARPQARPAAPRGQPTRADSPTG